MFLAWNYTLELFFWIILGAVILVSLTILLTSPIFRFKKSETSEETLLLIGESVDSPKGKIVNQNTLSGRVEEELEILEEIEKEETEQEHLPISVRMKAYAIVIAYVLYSFFVSIIGVLIIGGSGTHIFSENLLNWITGVILVIVGFATFLNGLISLYGFLTNQNILVRDSCRTTAALFLLMSIFGTSWDDYFYIFVITPLLFSGDLKRVWKWVSSNEKSLQDIWDEQWTRLRRWIGNILGLLRKEWRIVLTYTGVCYSLCVCVLGILIFWEVTQSTHQFPGSIFRTSLGNFTIIFSGTIFLTGVACMLSLITDNQKWSKYSCRVAAIVLLLFSIFCIAVAEMNLDSVSPTQQRFLGILDVDFTNVDMDEWWVIRKDLNNASILSFYFGLGSLLFSGDLKRGWKWVSATLTNLSNENENKEEVTLYMEGKAAAAIFGYSLFSLLIFYIGLAWESHIESDPRELDKIFSFLLKCLLLINGFTLYYGFYQNNTNVLKISGRIVAFIFFIGHEDMNMGFFPDGWNYTFFLLGLLALLSSGDLKRLWERMTSNEEEDVTQFGKWVENILKLLREKWMAINTYTGIRYLLYLLAFLSVILFLAVFIFQFF